MPAFLTVDHLSVATADGKPLFSDLSFVLNREVIGLVGRNGCGKSTLLSVLAGDREAASGHITRHGHVALLRQVRAASGSVAEALGVAEALELLRRMEVGLGSPADAALADWTLEGRIDDILRQMGLDGLDLNMSVAGLSGGERMRLAISALLLCQPDVLLLDEPTNDMDVEGRALVINLLKGWRGGALVASHDRALLEEMDAIIHLSPVEVDIFGGGWSDFVAARDAARERAAADLRVAERNAKQLILSVQEQAERQARRDKAGRAKRAKGDAPKILLDAQANRAQRTAGRGRDDGVRRTEQAQHIRDEARRQIEVVTPLHIDLPSSVLPAGRILLRMEDVICDRAAGNEGHGRRLFGPLSLVITGPQRIIISGSNGSGKSSLLRIIMGQEQPSSGTIFRAEGMSAMLDQHVSLIDPGLTLLENMQARYPDMSVGRAHDVLARFAFRNRDALRPAGGLSGGERLRAGLAMVMGGPVAPQLLVLDEPTNHLDIETVEILEHTLRQWDGALLMVSHDRAFLDAAGYDREINL
ncbi:MAG: ABC-F family ATP-binding cassette domain-containing protein [Sphingobium sp.]|nr:ABC-F family ATP-binding cassette domain-containing protein [Sphingobium sp.]